MNLFERKKYLQKCCGTSNVVVKHNTEDGLRYSVIRKRCHSWLCPKCARKLYRRWLVSIESYFEGRRVRFLTLTSPPSLSVTDSYVNLPQAWNRLRSAIIRKYGQFRYVRVVEVQPGTQRAHFHVLLDVFISQSWLSSVVERSGFGKIFDIRLAEKNGLKYYLAKYLGKPMPMGQGAEAMFIARSRRVSGARGFVLQAYNRSSGRLLLSDLPTEYLPKLLPFIAKEIKNLGFYPRIDYPPWFDCVITACPVCHHPLEITRLEEKELDSIFINSLFNL
jgi:hypothetical protein